MPIRNPFARRPGVPTNLSDNASDGSQSATGSAVDVAHPGFERVDTVGSKASSGLSIRSSRRSQDTGEYKMSGETAFLIPCATPTINTIQRWMQRSSDTFGRQPRMDGRQLGEKHWLTFFSWTIVVNDSGIYLPVRILSL